MKKAILILAVLSLAAFAGQIAIDLTPVQGTDADWLAYDDGTAKWLVWGGTYKGVWFNTDDFIPGDNYGIVEQSQIWFYHHADYPWDTSDFYMELWNGDAMAPTAQLDQTQATAIHYAPVFVTYSTPIDTDENFWLIANTELSAGGWPSILADFNAATHTFLSDDFIIWEPYDWNFFIRAYADIEPLSLDNSTWGSLKATF